MGPQDVKDFRHWVGRASKIWIKWNHSRGVKGNPFGFCLISKTFVSVTRFSSVIIPLCCKKFANFQQSSWKIILSHYLRQVGGRLLLSCNFSVKKLPVTLTKFYVEYLQTFSEHSASVREQILNLSNSSRSSTVIWNNRHILIDGKSVFYQRH